MSEDLAASIEAAAEALKDLEEKVLEYTFETDRDITEVGGFYYLVGELLDSISFSKDNMGDLLSKLMAVYDILSLEEYGIAIEKVQAKSRVKWDNPTTKATLAEKIVAEYIDEKTGTLDIPPSQLVQKAFDYTGLTWKVTKLREIGMNPDQYCEKKDGKISFRVSTSIHANKEQEDGNDDFI